MGRDKRSRRSCPVIITRRNVYGKKVRRTDIYRRFHVLQILEDDPGLCRELLALALGRPVGELVVNRQKPIEIIAGSKGVRFDVYAEVDDKIIYNVEMQNSVVDNIAKRTRYSQGMIDLNLIKRGAKYRDLNRSYVIYICKFNINNSVGLHKYSFANLCREDTAVELGDEAEKIFLCAKETADDISDKLKDFLEYIADGNPSDEFTHKLENAVLKARDHLEWRQEYMTFLEQLEKAEERGIEKGRAVERINTERERQRADAAEERADAAKERADAAEERADAAEERADTAEESAEAALKENAQLKAEMEKLKELLAAKK